MFNLIKFALHFDPINMTSFDPMVVNLIRQEREERINTVHKLKTIDSDRIVPANEVKQAA